MATRLNARRGAQQRHSAARQNAVNATCVQPARACYALATCPNTRRDAHQRHNAVRRNAVSATCDRPRADGARAQQAAGPPPSQVRRPAVCGRKPARTAPARSTQPDPPGAGGLLCAGARPPSRTTSPRFAAKPGPPACAWWQSRGHREQGQTGVALCSIPGCLTRLAAGAAGRGLGGRGRAASSNPVLLCIKTHTHTVHQPEAPHSSRCRSSRECRRIT